MINWTDIKTFLYGTIATLFCGFFMVIGGFTLWGAYELGVDGVTSSPFWVIIFFFGMACGVAGIHGFWCFLKEEGLI
jgi:hypothetical protein